MGIVRSLIQAIGECPHDRETNTNLQLSEIDIQWHILYIQKYAQLLGWVELAFVKIV
jgi:hypothetical protein